MILIIVAVAAVVLLLTSRAMAGFYIDYLWHQNLGRTDVFWGVLDAKLFLFLGFAVLFVILIVLNLLIADRLAPASFATADTHPVVARFHEVFDHRMRIVRIVAATIFGLIVAVPAAGHWQEWLLFRNSVSFGKSDPQFSTDIGFYVFRLPFLNFLIDWLFLAVLLVLILTVAVYILNGGILVAPPMPKIRRATKAHFAVLLAVLALLRAGGYWLERYDLTTERRGYVQGATYSVVKAQLPAVLLLMLIALLVAALFLYSIRSGSWRIPLVSCALWIVIALFGGVVYPGVIQALVVNPSQKEKEAPYIDRNITATRDALGLNNVQTKSVTFSDLSAPAIQKDLAPLKDVRLLDPAVMLSRFGLDKGQVAGLAIKDLDVDRYNIDGRLQQTMVAARELDLANVGNTSWQGKHLIATHGCGVVAAPAGQVEDNNRPVYSELKVDKPELYFSPAITDFAIVDTSTSEKPCGTTVASYTGTGGVQLNSGFRKLAFALSFFDYNLFGSDSVTSNSRIQWIRAVDDRVSKLAPFLHFDTDPYPVVLDGKVLWVVDGFTTTDQYPYAQNADTSQLSPTSGLNHTFNYIRNSVKVTVDAYNGDVTFYDVSKNADPILKAWEGAFPNLFVDASQMPKGLPDHLRYPEDLFRVQTAAYARYQLAPSAFFERTNAWSVSQAPSVSPNQQSTLDNTTASTDAVNQQTADDTGSTSQRFTPYYTMFHPPGTDTTGTFSILRPFAPYSKNDKRPELRSFMLASSDPETYGQLTAYIVTNEPDGPAKVANNAESEAEISRQITLLDTNGSQVQFGDMQLVPIATGLLYIRPMYVLVNKQAEFRKVIVSYNSNAVIDDSIGGALSQLFPSFSGNVGDRPATSTTTPGGSTGSGGTSTTTPTTNPSTGGADQTPNELLQQAQNLFDAADAALQKTPPDYTTFGADQTKARALIAQAIQILQSGG